MREAVINAGISAPGEYVPAGEAQGTAWTFGRHELATALGVTAERVAAALLAELGCWGGGPWRRE